MESVKLRNKSAEEYYFRILRRWREAGKNMGAYDEASLRFLWIQLEDAWKRIGYVIGDPD
jgi:hypothetical protein